MREFLYRLPNWLRWALLIPVSLVGGLIVGIIFFYLFSKQAATDDAPIMYLAIFGGTFLSNYTFMYLAREIAPAKHKLVVTLLITLLVIFAIRAASRAINKDEVEGLIYAAAQLTACVVAWKKLAWDYLKLISIEEENS